MKKVVASALIFGMLTMPTSAEASPLDWLQMLRIKNSFKEYKTTQERIIEKDGSFTNADGSPKDLGVGLHTVSDEWIKAHPKEWKKWKAEFDAKYNKQSKEAVTTVRNLGLITVVGVGTIVVTKPQMAINIGKNIPKIVKELTKKKPTPKVTTTTPKPKTANQLFGSRTSIPKPVVGQRGGTIDKYRWEIKPIQNGRGLDGTIIGELKITTTDGKTIMMWSQKHGWLVKPDYDKWWILHNLKKRLMMGA